MYALCFSSKSYHSQQYHNQLLIRLVSNRKRYTKWVSEPLLRMISCQCETIKAKWNFFWNVRLCSQAMHKTWRWIDYYFKPEQHGKKLWESNESLQKRQLIYENRTRTRLSMQERLHNTHLNITTQNGIKTIKKIMRISIYHIKHTVDTYENLRDAIEARAASTVLQ